ncbi:hypothetical protein C1896_11240 [Pseudomonadaceae bacterium SI-3]|nr:hypothetical protein C1896_11240 [Pseudomonadaceae bacterium SI-3]
MPTFKSLLSTTLASAVAVIALSGTAVAQPDNALSAGPIPAIAQASAASEAYSYGTQLDISQVISLTENSSNCGLVDAEMTYLDSDGKKRVLVYRKLSATCSDG